MNRNIVTAYKNLSRRKFFLEELFLHLKYSSFNFSTIDTPNSLEMWRLLECHSKQGSLALVNKTHRATGLQRAR